MRGLILGAAIATMAGATVHASTSITQAATLNTATLNTSSTVPGVSATSRIVIRQDSVPIETTPAVIKREIAPDARMKTVLRCRDGVCMSVSVKTRVGATEPVGDKD